VGSRVRCLALGSLVGAVLLSFVAGVPSSRAATFTVDDTSDAVDVSPGDGVCAAATGTCTLRAAIQEANALAGADEVQVPAGTFLLTLAGADEGAAATGDIDITDSVVVSGAGSGVTILDGGGLDRIFEVLGGAFRPEVTIRGLTLQNGSVVPDNPLLPVGDGGGMRALNVVLHLEDLVARANVAQKGGGALVSNSTGDIVGCVFEDNRAANRPGFRPDGSGGGLSLEAGEVTVRDCRFVRNHSDDGAGGGGLEVNRTRATIASCRFYGNTSDSYGGAVESHLAVLTFTDCSFERGSAAYGGGLLFTDTQATLRRCAVVGNRATQLDGGGIYVDGNAVELSNVTVSGNAARGEGGGLFVATDATLVLDFATVADNTAGSGGAGLQVSASGGRVLSRGVLLSGNTVAGVPADCSALIELLGPTFVRDPAGACSVRGDASFDRRGVDPQIEPLVDDGVSLAVHPLADTSPALDAIADGNCLDGLDEVVPDDERGVVRPLDGDGDGVALCDAGAVESVPPQPDADGDGVPDPADCAPYDPAAFAVPLEPTLFVTRDVTGAARLDWDDPAPTAGSDTTSQVVSDTLASLPAVPGASGPCVASGLLAPTWTDSRAGSLYYLARGANICGPAAATGWGRDSLGRDRPACP